MHLLVTGAKGQIGREICQYAEDFGFIANGFSHTELDITNPQQIEQCIAETKPALIINAAAYTAVDKAENEPHAALTINCDGVKNLAQLCRRNSTPLLHISTDYVFDGNQPTPYLEDDDANPINAYGQSKWKGEQVLREHWEQHVILRTSWLFGLHGNNFVKTILRLASEPEEIKIVTDQTGCPTPAVDAAKTLLTIAKQIMEGKKTWGTYHYCGDSAVTWYTFANTILQLAKTKFSLQNNHITPITTEKYSALAKRPKNSILKVAKLVDAFGITSCDWHRGLHDVLEKL